MRTIIEALKFSCEKKNIYPKPAYRCFEFGPLFVGAQDRDFEIFRKQEGNFYQAVITSVV